MSVLFAHEPASVYLSTTPNLPFRAEAQHGHQVAHNRPLLVMNDLAHGGMLMLYLGMGE